MARAGCGVSAKKYWYSYGTVWIRIKNTERRFGKSPCWSTWGFAFDTQNSRYWQWVWLYTYSFCRWGFARRKSEKNENEVHIIFDGNKPNVNRSVFWMLVAWAEQAQKYRSGEISKEQYDEWRHHYPKYDITQRLTKVPSQELINALVEQFKEQLKTEDWKQV